MGRRRKKTRQNLIVVTDRNSPLFDEMHYGKSCEGKTRYETDWQAKYDADYQSKLRGGVSLSWYHCPYCGYWHLTSQQPST